ncbi:MOS1T transposase, partial [Pseudoatta argentina]
MSKFVPNKVYLRGILLHYFIQKKSAAEAHRILVQTYGDDALSDTTCRDWFRRFKNNDFQLEDKERSGAPKKFQDRELELLLDEKYYKLMSQLFAIFIGINNAGSLSISIDAFEMTIDTTEIIVSLNITSLFINIPLDFALDGLEKRWDSIKCATNILKDEFINAVKFVLISYFTFNGIIYKQTFGTLLDSPIDDVFMIASKDKVSLILNSFNDQHDRLKFTIEYEEVHCLNFLDLTVINKDNTIILNWYIRTNNRNSGKDNGYLLRMIFNYINKRIYSINKSTNTTGYRCLNKFNKFIKVHKDKNQQKKNNNDVIYKLNCNNCDVSYVGQTKRQLQIRIKEHRNNIKLDQSKHSVITKHITEYIKEQKNVVNLMKDNDCALLDSFYFNILNDIREHKLSVSNRLVLHSILLIYFLLDLCITSINFQMSSQIF